MYQNNQTESFFVGVILVLWSVGPNGWSVYLLPLNTNHSGVVFVTGDLGGPLEQYGPLSQ